MNPFDILGKLEDPQDGSQFVLYLLKGRSAYRVFKALDELAATEEELLLLLSSQEFIELIDEVAVVFANIRAELKDLKKSGIVDSEQYLRTVESHYGQALDAAAAFAALLNLDPQDVVSVLLNA